MNYNHNISYKNIDILHLSFKGMYSIVLFKVLF